VAEPLTSRPGWSRAKETAYQPDAEDDATDRAEDNARSRDDTGLTMRNITIVATNGPLSHD